MFVNVFGGRLCDLACANMYPRVTTFFFISSCFWSILRFFFVCHHFSNNLGSMMFLLDPHPPGDWKLRLRLRLTLTFISWILAAFDAWAATAKRRFRFVSRVFGSFTMFFFLWFHHRKVAFWYVFFWKTGYFCFFFGVRKWKGYVFFPLYCQIFDPMIEHKFL